MTEASGLRDRLALVTGASSGIGRAIALGLAERAARLWLVGRREDALSEVATKANGATLCPMDLTEPDSIESLAQRLRDEVGRLDVLVLSSGTIAFGEHGEAGIDDLDAQYAANLRAPYLLVQSLLPLLREAQGQVVFVNSTAGLGARPGVGQFAATQAAFRSMADSLRQEVNEQGIRVLSLFPGRTATPRQERIHGIEGKDYRPEQLMQPEDVARMAISTLELPRTAEVTDIVMRPFVKPPG
jgi:NADP-dependent 3-hydroxy acid dehydrogenase YdfG